MGVARAPGRLPCGENGEEGFKNTGGAGTHTLQAHHMGITRVLATSKPPPFNPVRYPPWCEWSGREV